MAVYWGARDVDAVAEDGDATQLFPVGATAGDDTSTTFPPSGGGRVRLPAHGRVGKIEITPDGTNSGYVEIWDVAGLDRGTDNNVNSEGEAIDDTYLQANGTLIQKVLVDATVAPFTSVVEDVPFNKGLAVRVVLEDGSVSVAPFVEGGFRVIELAGK